MIGILVIHCLLIVPAFCHLIFSDLKELFESPDQVCQNDNYSKENFINKVGINKFTGVRVFKVYKMALYPTSFEESIRFIYCENGKKLHQKNIIQQGQTNDAYWTETFDIPSFNTNTRFKFSKRKGFVNHDKSYVVPGSIIGGVFHCFNDDCTTDNSEPVLPLYSYLHKPIWTQTTRGDTLYNWTIEKYLPLMSTSNDHDRAGKLTALVTGQNRHRTIREYIHDKFGKPRIQNVTNNCVENWCIMI